MNSSLSWGPHVDYSVKNALSKLWLLIRFKSRGASQDQLLTLYQLNIRCIAEFTAPSFHGSLTVDKSNCLERIQKKAFVIQILSQEKLQTRRLKLCENFAVKYTQNSRHADLFPTKPVTQRNTRQKQKYIEPKCITSRYYKSALPFLTRLINNVK